MCNCLAEWPKFCTLYHIDKQIVTNLHFGKRNRLITSCANYCTSVPVQFTCRESPLKGHSLSGAAELLYFLSSRRGLRPDEGSAVPALPDTSALRRASVRARPHRLLKNPFRERLCKRARLQSCRHARRHKTGASKSFSSRQSGRDVPVSDATYSRTIFSDLNAFRAFRVSTISFDAVSSPR